MGSASVPGSRTVPPSAGEDVEQVELHPEDARFLIQCDPAAIHYEIERVRASSETEGDLMTLLQQYLVRESGES